MEPTQRTRRRAPVWRALVLVVVVIATVGLGTDEARAADAIESTYEKPPSSPWAITWDENGDHLNDTCSPTVAPPQPYTFVYPNALGAYGPHPVIMWANGTSTSANPTCYYQPWLTLLAKWGFVVVATNTQQSGTGNELRLGAAAMANLNNDPSSIFFHKLDTAHIAAAGHSQGAIGAINAVLNAPDSLFASVLAMSTPDREDMAVYNDPECTIPFFCCALLYGSACRPVPVPPESALSGLDAPIFFARGTGLQNPWPCNIDDWISDKTAADWYSPAPSPYIAGTVRVTAPAPSQCNYFAPYPHTNLADGFGYMNAWLVYTLNLAWANPTTARAAFVGSGAEILHNDHWEGVSPAGGVS